MKKNEIKDLKDKEDMLRRRLRKSKDSLEQGRLKKKLARLTKLISWKID